MTNNRAELSPEEKRALLAQLLRKKAAATITTHPLSAAQYGLYFQHNFTPGNVAFNLMYALRIWSAVDVPALHRAFQAIVDRHASLRTTYAARDHEHVQQIHGHQAVAFEPIDAASWSWEQLTERMLAAADQPFDLERGPVLRVYLFSQAVDRHVLLIVVHHIAVDLWSLDLVMDELRQCYAAARSGSSALLPPLQLQYTDYVHWEAKLLASAEAERLWSYWQRQLAGELPTLNLPTDRPRPPLQTYRGAAETIKLSSALTSRLRMLARSEGATLYMVVLAAYQALLHRYSGQTDYCIGSPTVIRGRR
ncbi:MAG TPA: condensation domain-containing protein, partial [Herpetosiphonaceae bacterium]